MASVKQGEVIELEGGVPRALVLSKDVFNKTGLCIACPVAKRAGDDALHIPITLDAFSGVALCEHLRALDMKKRHYKTVGTLSLSQMQDVADAVQGIFDCYPYSVL